MTGRALDGLLVVAIEQAVAAPTCTVRLADAGARVIKIEREGGETARHYDRAVLGTSAYFAWLNRGKESTVLDLKSVDDIALMERMVAKADVFIQNLAPGAAARIGNGFDAKSLSGRFPRLVAIDIVGYGQDTPYKDMRAYDMLVQAESGVCSVTGTPDTPSKVGVSIADIMTGMNAHSVVLEALIQRGITGKGKSIEMSMFDSMADLMSVPLLHKEYAGSDTGRHGLQHASIYPYSGFKCNDGEIIIAIQTAAEWRRFCAGVLLRAELADDQRFIDNPIRVKNRAVLGSEITAVTSKISCAQMIDRLEANQIAWGRLSTVADVTQHPALRSMKSTLANGEEFNVPRPAGRDEFTPGPVPQTGEHTDSIRAEFRV